MDMLSHAIVMEEVSKVWPAAGLKLDEGLMRYIRLFGTADQKERWLPDLASAELVDAISLSEPDHGSDLAGIESTAEAVDDGYLLNGTKMWVTGAGAADLVAVVAKTDPGERHRGMSVFAVPTDADGFDVQPAEELMGYHASNTHEVVLNDVFVPAENLVGEENRGFYHTMEMLGENRVAVAARGLGVAAGAYEAAVDYAGERDQFDQPIKEFQAIRHKVADMAVKVENARNLVYNAARRCDAGEPSETEASMAKLYASEVAREVSSEAVQIHGGYGYTRDFPVEMHYRDAKGLEIYEGTSEVQRNIIADRILD
jgi:alkylation response protein AidB-like acyl-CoA dehydrogenase